jgi:hypothetical protein
MIAAAAMSFSSVSVVSNALRLRRVNTNSEFGGKSGKNHSHHNHHHNKHKQRR